MNTLRFSINVPAVDCYIYSGYLFLALEDGNFGYVSMSCVMHQLKDKYPQFRSLLKMSFERNDYFSNDTGKTFLGVNEVMIALIKLWDFASENVDFCLDFEDLEEDFCVIDRLPSFPILDIKMYAMTMFIGCKNGLFESQLNVHDNRYSISPSRLCKKFDAKVVGVNASCGSVVISAGQNGLFFGPFDMDEGVSVDEHAVEDVSFRTSWSSTDVVNYQSASCFDYLSSQVEKYQEKPLFSKFDERSERKRIIKLNERKYGMENLLNVGQFSLEDIIYAFNGSSSSFVLTRKGLYNMNFVKDENDVHLSSRINQLPLFDKKRKFQKPVSASVVPAGCVIEFFDSVVVVRDNQVIELEREPAYSVRSYMSSIRYRNLVSIVKQGALSIHSLNPFATYDFDVDKYMYVHMGNDRYAFTNPDNDNMPF